MLNILLNTCLQVVNGKCKRHSQSVTTRNLPPQFASPRALACITQHCLQRACATIKNAHCSKTAESKTHADTRFFTQNDLQESHPVTLWIKVAIHLFTTHPSKLSFKQTETSRPALLSSWLTDGGEVVSLTRRQLFSSGKIPAIHFCRMLSRPRGYNGMIMSIEKSNDIFGNRTRDLLAFRTMPQPTTLTFIVRNPSFEHIKLGVTVLKW
jgi:hypothetical protein